MSNQIEIATNILMMEEGWREKPYYCSEGYPTIGWGFKIGEVGDPLPAITMKHLEGDKKLADKIKTLDLAIAKTAKTALAYAMCNNVRKAVMISMAFQLGLSGLIKFKQTIKSIEECNWKLASEMMLDSLAARQTPARWKRAAELMRTGEIK